MILLTVLMTLAPSAQAIEPDALVAQLHGSVVKVRVREYLASRNEQAAPTVVASEGAGVLYGVSDRVLTAAHLVQTADEITVEFDDGLRIAARVHAAEPAADVALLQLDRRPDGKRPLALARSDAVRAGQRVAVIGAPFGLAGMISVGYVSGRQRPATPFGRLDELEMFVIDAHVERGSSGGGVFDDQGQLIGLVTSVRFRAGQAHGLGFAITSDTIRAMLVDRRSFWTGIGGYWLCGSTAKWLNVPQPAGLLVQRVARRSPAAQLGLRGGIASASVGEERFVIGGDIILSVQGIALTGSNDYARMQAALAGLDSGATLKMTVLREGRQIELEAPVYR